MVRFEIVPEKTALIVVDLQNLFVEGFEPISAPDGLEVLGLLNNLADICRQNGIQVIHTAHQLRDDHSNMGVLRQIAPLLEDEKFIDASSNPSHLHPDVVVKEGDIFLSKPRFGAFTGTDLDLILRGKGIDTVIICGIATNICCETTAREANHHEYKVIFLSDGTTTAGYDDQGFGYLSPEEVKKATLTTIAYLFGEVTTVDDVIGRIVPVAEAATY